MLSRVLERHGGYNKNRGSPFKDQRLLTDRHEHRYHNNLSGYPAEASHMDLNPRIEMFRRSTHNSIANGT